MKWIVFHFALCTILLGDYFSYEALRNKKFYQHKSLPAIIKNKPDITNIKHKEFLYSIVTGNKRGFKSQDEYKYFKKSGMLHLLTPSGLHLSSLFLPIYFLIRSVLIRNILLLLCGGVLLNTPGFDAAKRIWGIKFFLNNYRCTKSAFYIVFSLAYLFKPDLSFLMSFFFVGIIIHNPFKRISSTIFLFMASQILISYFFNQEYYPLGVIINPIATLIISAIFPFIVIGFFIPYFYESMLMPVIGFFFRFIKLVDIVPPLFNESFISVILILFIIFSKKWKFKSIGCFALLFQPLTTI